MSKAQEIFDLLAREGYRPTLETSERGATVLFKSRGDRMSFSVADNDPAYVQLFASYTNRFAKEAALEEANRTNQVFKSVKVTVSDDGSYVGFALEAWYAEVEQFAPLLDRWLGVLSDASSHLYNELHNAAIREGAARS